MSSIKDALENWEKENGMKASEATEVGLQFQIPPIEYMTMALASLTKCEKLSLSTNSIEKIVIPPTLTNLKILSLGRNNIKSFAGLEVLAETLEELWISYNLIEKLKGIDLMKKLKVLFIENNEVRDWNELSKVAELSENLRSFNIIGNPIVEDMEIEDYKPLVLQRLPFLKMIDGHFA